MDKKVFILWLLTIFFWGITPIVEKIGLKNVSSLMGLFIRTFFSLAGLFIAVLIFESASFKTLTSRDLLFFALSGILGGFLGMLTYFALLKTQTASQIVPLTATYPLVTTIFSILILKEEITISKILGTVFVIIGIFLLLRSSS